MIKTASQPTTILEGHLERITYRNEETQYTVARLRTIKTLTPVTVIGHMAPVSPGETLKLEGGWQTHPKYGQQFKITSYRVTLPASIEGIRSYLASGIIQGIGPQMAQRLVGRFGKDIFDVIENSPEKLLEIEGIGQAKSALICSAWKTHHTLRGLMGFLKEMGVKPVHGARILKKYGTDAERIIRKDPYRLAKDIPDTGFEIADAIARHLGVSEDDPERTKACIVYLINQAANDGHMCMEENDLVGRCEKPFQITRHAARNALDEMVSTRQVAVEKIEDDSDEARVYLKPFHQAETGLANRLKALMSVPVSPPGIDAERIRAVVLEKLALSPSPEQRKVLEKILSLRAVIITGGPGTGKTTLIRSITAVFEALGKKVLLAAPTGRAARRLSEITRRKAVTVHKLLGYRQSEDRFEKDEKDPLEADAVIVDEASMVDTVLMHHLLRAVPMTAVLVLVGDVFQLPSVGPGNVLSDMIDSHRVPVFELKEIFRQARESQIVVNAHRVRDGKFPDLEAQTLLHGDGPENLSEFYFLEQHDPKKVVSLIVDLCQRIIPRHFEFDPMDDIQVLTPMHRGLVGTINLNQELQSALNPNPVLIETPGGVFKIGDKVMHLKNNYQKEVFNGDIGTIREIDKKAELLSVDYYGRIVNYDFLELDDISCAYAISVHKSQGSEYPAVIVPLMTQHFPLLQRNLLYTAITRGKKLVILTGVQKALSIALGNDKPRQRLSGLAARLAESRRSPAV